MSQNLHEPSAVPFHINCLQHLPRHRQLQPQHQDESSAPAAQPNSNNQALQEVRRKITIHPLQAILRMANNEIGVDSRDNILTARRGERPTNLATLIERAAQSMGGNTHEIMMILESDLAIITENIAKTERDIEKITEERDRALHELGELQARFNEISDEEM